MVPKAGSAGGKHLLVKVNLILGSQAAWRCTEGRRSGAVVVKEGVHLLAL